MSTYCIKPTDFTPLVVLAHSNEVSAMALRLASSVFAEVIVAIVTVVWATSFVIGILNPHFDSSQYNNIFMVIAGSGVFAAAFTHHKIGGNGHDSNDK